MTRSEQLFERAVKRIPGGVNSPVRSYGAIGEAPRFIEKADKFLKEGASVVLAASSQESADVAVDKLKEKYPN